MEEQKYTLRKNKNSLEIQQMAKCTYVNYKVYLKRINDNRFHDGHLGGKKTKPMEKRANGASNFNRYDSHVLFFFEIQ